MRIVPILALAALVACASTPAADQEQPPPPDSGVKPAARGLALVVYWFEGFDGEKQGFEVATAQKLKETYLQQPQIFRREGHFARFDPKLFAQLAGSGSDDAVIVELERGQGQNAEKYGGKVSVVAVSGEKNMASLTIPPSVPSLNELADKIRRELSNVWTDPAAGPALDPLTVADRLADEGACDLAVQIYARELPKRKGVYVVQAHELNRSWERYKACKKKIETREREIADRAATFKLEREFIEVGPRLKEVIEGAIHTSRFSATLAKQTNKPTTLMVGSGQVVLRMRYQRDLYQKKVGNRSEYKGQPAVFLEPFVPAMRAVLRLKEAAKDDVPKHERPGIEDLRTSLRLTLLSGDYIEIEFAGGAGRVMIAETLRVHSEGRDDTEVQTSGTRRDLRALVFPLGPTTTAEGNPTVYGLVTEFLASAP